MTILHNYIQDLVGLGFELNQTTFRRVAIDQGIPILEVPDDAQPVELRDLQVHISISGFISKTTMTMEFFNPNYRDFEGQLEIPMPDGAVVCDYAIDIDEQMVEGVIVSKQKARMVLEAEMKKGIDPGLVEQVQGNLYRTRVYPLPSFGSRIVRISFVNSIPCSENSGTYRLPLKYAQVIPKVQVQVEISQSPSIPKIETNNFSLEKRKDSDIWEDTKTFAIGELSEDIVIHLPDIQQNYIGLEQFDDETYFLIRKNVSKSERLQEKWNPKKIGIAWDNSGSITQSQQLVYIQLLKNLLTKWPNVIIELKSFHYKLEVSTIYSPEQHSELLQLLKNSAMDGSTRLDNIDLGKSDVEAWFLFTDGQSSIGGCPEYENCPIFTFNQDVAGNSSLLRFISKTTGGQYHYIDNNIDGVIKKVLEGPLDVSIEYDSHCDDVYLDFDGNSLIIVGKLKDLEPQNKSILQIACNQETHVFELSMDDATEGQLISRNWAQYHMQELNIYPEKNKEQLLAFGRKHKIVTSQTSLLVLETLEQCLEYDIAPAKSRKDMYDKYQRKQRSFRDKEQNRKKKHHSYVKSLWEKHIKNLEKSKKRRDKDVKKKKKKGLVKTMLEFYQNSISPQSVPREHQMARSQAFIDEFDLPRFFSSNSLRNHNVVTYRISPSGFSSMVSHSQETTSFGHSDYPELSDSLDKGEAFVAVEASTGVQPWQSSTPYMKALKKAKEENLYDVYLMQRKEFNNSPSFYLDCGDFFIKKGLVDLGIRILSNLLEIKIQYPQFMRLYAWRLQNIGKIDEAIEVLEKILLLRDDEPQSHRDLALALSERWEKLRQPKDLRRAIRLLYNVVEKRWAGFPEIEIIALTEINRLIQQGRQYMISTPKFVHPDFIKHVEMDLRISLTWDADATDIDLHVEEPTGEVAYYGNRMTALGGVLSRDFTEGYGPEEYTLSNAFPGKYKIVAKYFRSNQTQLTGPCTVVVNIYTNYGRDNEKKQTQIVRLKSVKDSFEVAEVFFDNTQKMLTPPSDTE